MIKKIYRYKGIEYYYIHDLKTWCVEFANEEESNYEYVGTKEDCIKLIDLEMELL